MENHSGPIRDDEEMELPPGFRFHPTDEELITHYLSPKVIDRSFCAKAIGEVDFNKVEPWDLPWRAKMGEREFYFFCVKDRKYPTGLRTNRATDAGYWKATGKDKEIYRGKNLVGMKKTLVFYKGRAPKGEKTNWVMHEYRLEGNNSPYNFPGTPKNEWVISRIFHKSSGGKKLHISSLARMSSHRNEVHPSNLPLLKECSAYDDHTRSTTVDASHLTYLTDPTEDNKPLEDMVDSFNNSFLFPKISVSESIFPTQFVPNFENLQYPDCGMVEDQSMLRFLVRNDGFLEAKLSPETGMSTEISSGLSGHETGQRVEDPISSVAPADLDCFWNY